MHHNHWLTYPPGKQQPYNLFVRSMFNLNILLGVLYLVLVVCQLLVVKNLLRRKMQRLLKVVDKHQNQITAGTPNSNHTIVAKDVLRHFMIRHPFSRCCNRQFPHRSCELLVFCAAVAILVCSNAMEQLVVAIPVAAVIDCTFVAVSAWAKLKCEQRLEDQVAAQLKIEKECNYTLQDTLIPNEPLDMRMVRVKHLRVFEYELGYMVLSIASLILLGAKLYQVGYAPIVSLPEVQLTAIIVGCQLLVLRPLSLFIVGSICSVLLAVHSDSFSERYPRLYAAITTDYHQEELHRRKTEALAQDTNQANRRVVSELRIEDYRQEQRTEEHINTHPNGILEQMHTHQQSCELHSRKPSDMGLVVSVIHPPTEEQEKYDEEQRISPIKIGSQNSVKFNSHTIKKQHPLKIGGLDQGQIREIEQFQIAQHDEEESNYRTKKPQQIQLETAVCTSTETAPGHNNVMLRKDPSGPLHELQINGMGSGASTKPLYNEFKHRSGQILGSIIDNYDEQPTENPYQVEGGKRKKSRNKRIHIVYTQESSEYDQDSRSYSVDTQSRHISREQATQQKENVPEVSSLANMKPSIKRSINGTIQLPPLRPNDLMLIRSKQPDGQNVQPTQQSCDRKRKRRRTKRLHEQQPRQKSPYLQFLPKMLKKEQTQRNHSCIIDSRKHSARKKKAQQAPPPPPNLQLHIIKKTISSELDTVYT